MIAAALERTGLAPPLLELEITESMMMQTARSGDRRAAAASARWACGWRSTISAPAIRAWPTCKRFPIDGHQDRPLVRARLPHDADDAAIVTAIIALAHSLGLKVVAEGVETADPARFLAPPGLRHGARVSVQQAGAGGRAVAVAEAREPSAYAAMIRKTAQFGARLGARPRQWQAPRRGRVTTHGVELSGFLRRTSDSGRYEPRTARRSGTAASAGASRPSTDRRAFGWPNR